MAAVVDIHHAMGELSVSEEREATRTLIRKERLSQPHRPGQARRIAVDDGRGRREWPYATSLSDDPLSLAAIVGEDVETMLAGSLVDNRVNPLSNIKPISDWEAKAASDNSSANEVDPNSFPCHEFLSASDIAPHQNCSSQCPYWAESSERTVTCLFKCVAASDCGDALQGIYANATVASSTGYCRVCASLGCIRCMEHSDDCALCDESHYLVSGTCMHKLSLVRFVIFGVSISICIFSAMWYIEVWMRPWLNLEGVHDGLRCRSASKLRRPLRDEGAGGDGRVPAGSAGGSPTGADGDSRAEGSPSSSAEGSPVSGEMTPTRGRRPLWPLTTNLLHEPAGGPGNVMFFRFHAALLVWATVGFLVFLAVAMVARREVVMLGMREASNPRDLCRVVSWGHRLQTSVKSVKVGFCFFLYLFTTIGTLCLSFWQQRAYKALSASRSTMQDFAAYATGLPRLPGTMPVEMELSSFFQQATQQNVVGASVCWDIVEQGAEIIDILEEQLMPPPPNEERGTQSVMEQKGLRWRVFGIFDWVMLRVLEVPMDKHAADRPDPAKLARELETTPFAWIVFETESARDAAVRRVQAEGGVAWRGATLRLETKEAEPESVRWRDLGHPIERRYWRISVGFLKVCTAIAFWTLFIYLPNVMFQMAFQYDDVHQSPNGWMMFILSYSVTFANIGLASLCAYISEDTGLHFEEEKEALFMLFFFFAGIFNIMWGTALTAWAAYRVMIGANAHTYGGVPLSEVQGLEAIYETYPIQKILGYQIVGSAYPATFLSPFLLEPILTVWLPYHIMVLIVRSNPALKGARAMKALAIMSPMSAGRYGDLILNVTTLVLVLFVPMGWILPLFGGFIFSHLFIVFWDHYRVLRCVPSFHFENPVLARLALKLLSVPCGLMSIAIYLNLNCEAGGSMCMKGSAFWLTMFMVFSVHCVVHIFLLRRITLYFSGRHAERSTPTQDVGFPEVSRKTASSWFTTNPAFCLRSKYVYKHDPPCGYLVRGQEHLLRRSPQANQYFEDGAVETETYY